MFRRRRAQQDAADAALDAVPTPGDEVDADEADAGSGADAEGAEGSGMTPAVAGPVFDRAQGPWDDAEVPDDGITRLDLGGLLVPGADGMELRLDVDEANDQVVAVTVAHEQSALQLMVFAAPRTDGIWDDVRGEIRANLAGSGLVDEVPGEFGRELHATLPSTDPQGRSVMQPVRFVGVDGPRWFLRGLFSGAAAREAAAAAPLEAVLRATVVVRGDEAMAPGDAIPLHVPTEVPEGISRREDEPADTGDGRRRLPPPERGPEITEIR